MTHSSVVHDHPIQIACRARHQNRQSPNSLKRVSLAILTTMVMAFPIGTHAADGCLVLLCFAAPSWSAIPQCVPPIEEVLNDLAHGRPFPTCDMSGPGNSANHQWSAAPRFCPPQYTHAPDDHGPPIYTCDYVGAVSVQIERALWTRTWWSISGATVTEYTPVAKSLLGTWDTQFDDDYAAWQKSLPPQPSCDGC